MPKYTFTFKKDDIFVEFTTTDKETVERQFQIWVADADDYAKQQTGKRKQETKEANSKQQMANLSEEINASTLSPLNTSTKIEATAEEFVPAIAPQPEVLDQASTLLKTINTIQSEELKGKKEPEPEKVAPANNFEEILGQNIENPTFEPTKTQDKLFLNLVNSKNTKDKFHYLIITAYYLAEFEKLQRFSLKQINSKMMQNLSEVIDHSTLQEAINQNFIEVVPDLTGISDVAEYKLTLAGEEFFANKI